MNNYKNLLWFWTFSIIAIFLAYHWLDRSIASFVYTHHWREHLSNIPGLVKIIEWPWVISYFAPILFFVLLIFRNNAVKNPSPWQNMLLILCLSVFLTYLLKNDCKWIFSRYWPQTWKDNNISWIHHHAFGFQWLQGKPFEGTDATGSFPSGHSSIAFATFISIGLYYKKWLKFCVLLASVEALAMVAFNYHFLSDAIAGACLGTTCALLCYRFFHSKPASGKLIV